MKLQRILLQLGLLFRLGNTIFCIISTSSTEDAANSVDHLQIEAHRLSQTQAHNTGSSIVEGDANNSNSSAFLGASDSRSEALQFLQFASVGNMSALRDDAREAFLHAYDSYVEHGYPYDEVKPISCRPRDYRDRSRGTLDDSLGDYMTTLVDSLDTLLLLKEFDRFEKALQMLKSLSFDKNLNVSVFEANIRIVGGLLSAHQLALRLNLSKLSIEPTANTAPQDATSPTSRELLYDGRVLLDLAVDLSSRLLPAFKTKTGIPYHRVNLRSGRIPKETTNTCSAAGGSFLLEMSLLSLLTGNASFARAAFKATSALWSRRSALNLIGSEIDIATGKWNQRHTGIGAGVDSFYETMLKAAILLNDNRLMSWFHEAYVAVETHSLFLPWHLDVQMDKGNSALPHSPYVSALGAFWPAMQVLYGDIGRALLSFQSYLDLWHRFKALPDIFNIWTNSTIAYCFDSPLRPEMLESAYHIFSATKSTVALQFGKDWLHELNRKSRVRCGFASIADVNTGKLDDRMDSFVLAESFKYLYLLFDEAHETYQRRTIFCEQRQPDQRVEPSQSLRRTRSRSRSHSNTAEHWTYNCLPKSSVVFSTEGHLLVLDPRFKSQHITRHFGSTSVLAMDLVCPSFA